ncbi:hypothetical protein YC2023_117514 [Brassica napus]
MDSSEKLWRTCKRVSPCLLFTMINNLLNSVVRVLLSYGRSHWFKSNSRYNLLDTMINGV